MATFNISPAKFFGVIPPHPLGKLWRVTGQDRSQTSRTIRLRAEDHNAAVRKASQSPNCLVVRDCVLISD
jgi:hypothetical protein